MDIEEAIKNFEEYVKQYDNQNSNIKLKINHTYRVMKISECIAQKLHLREEEIKLAKLIALLHDIGRFEEIEKKRYKEYNHAKSGVEILFKENLIRKFTKENKYDTIIAKAIFYHNTYKIEKEKFTAQELLQMQIIRDADKLDNFEVKKIEPLEIIFPNMPITIKQIEESKISENVYSDFLQHKYVRIEGGQTWLDLWICVIAFIYDLNFFISLEYVKQKDYINILIDRIQYKDIDTKNKMENIRSCAKKYIETCKGEEKSENNKI